MRPMASPYSFRTFPSRSNPRTNIFHPFRLRPVLRSRATAEGGQGFGGQAGVFNWRPAERDELYVEERSIGHASRGDTPGDFTTKKDCFEYFTQAKRLTQRRLYCAGGNFLAKFDYSNPSCQYEADFAVPGFFIQPHGIEKFSALARV